MDITVVKSDGMREAFSIEKIQQAIEQAGGDAGVAVDEIEEAIEKITEQIMSELEDREEVATSEIRSWILSSLEGVNTAIISSWEEYEEERDKYSTTSLE